MQVFISWSGELSRKLALAFSRWLEQVVQSVDPFMSEEDVAKGSRGLNEIEKALESSSFGLADLWSNPSGTWQSHRAAREVYRFLGAEDRIGIWFRGGGHDHGASDWRAFLDFMEWQLCGKQPACPYDLNPFPELPVPFTWSNPPGD